MTEQEIADLGPAFAAVSEAVSRLLPSEADRRPLRHLLPGTALRPAAQDASSRSPWPPAPPCAPSRSSWPPPRGTTAGARDRSSSGSPAVSADATGRPARHRRRHRRDELPSRRATRRPACSGSTSAASARSTTASSPSTWRGQGDLPGPARCRPVPARVVGRGPPALPGGWHPRRRRLPAQVADRPGPVAAAATTTGCRSTG